MSQLRKWFGPSKDEIWHQLADQIGARFVEGSWTKGDKVVATHGDWTLTLDTYVVSTGHTTMVFTRMRAPYVNPDGFRFTIYRRSIFTELGKMLGMQDVEIGLDPQFDHDFVIKGTDESKLRALFADDAVRTLVAKQPELRLTVKDDEGWFGPHFPSGVDELNFAILGVIKDVDRLKDLYELFAATLDRLCRIGSAYDDKPGVELI
ncbi:MAG TPA: hypothetical protein VIP11_08350 [Gemmatimonadaceae bacterium]